MEESLCQCEHQIKSVKTIDDIYDELIAKLKNQGKIQEISSHLLKLPTNENRVYYLYNILRNLGCLPNVQKNEKNDRTSVWYRCCGNKYYQQKKYFHALQCYNLACLYAVPSSENIVLAISNRSAVSLAIEKYQECLEDIKWILKNEKFELPANIVTKLTYRKTQCEAKLASAAKTNEVAINKKIEKTLQISGKCDEKYISASSKVKVLRSNEMGRHVIANEDIKPGEVLAQEEPFLVVPLKSQFLVCCAYCLSRTLNIYPCQFCTYTLYCSVQCCTAAFKDYHKTECPLLCTLLLMKFTKMELLALRITLKSVGDFEDRAESLISMEEAEANKNTDKWGCFKYFDKWVYSSEYYNSIHTLESNVEKRSVSDIFRKSVTAAVLTHFLVVTNYLKEEDVPGEQRIKRYVAGNILHHIMTSPTNMHGLSTNIENAEGKYIDEYNIASGAYAFLSLLNHSCAPSVVRYSKLGCAQMTLVAIRPIKKGMQIFDNYGYHHALMNRESRQSDLKFQYKFTCVCEACVNDWPLHANLKEAESLPAGVLDKKYMCLSAEVIEGLMRGDKITAIEVYPTLCELIEVLDPYAPCRELAECQEAMKQCLSIFHGVVPHGYSNILDFDPWAPCESCGELKFCT